MVELSELDGARIAILGLHTASAAPSCICVTWVKLPGVLAMLDARLSISRLVPSLGGGVPLADQPAEAADEAGNALGEPDQVPELSGAEAVSSW